MKSPKDILKQYWNYETFRPLQEQIINSVLEKKDTLCILPTGGGKSLCYQVPGLILDGITLVISPLIALMKDQVRELNQMNIKAYALTSNFSTDDCLRILDNCSYGKVKFLYVSPERLFNEILYKRIIDLKINLVAIDEAHCISEWGNDFRPAYKKLSILKDEFTNTPIISLTATATKQVEGDILKSLKLLNPNTFKGDLIRPNLSFKIIETQDKTFILNNLISKSEGSVLVYTRSRKETIKLKNILIQQKINSEAFHGGVTNEKKDFILTNWLNNKIKVVIATSAFGMGINKKNLRLVIHYSPPESIENYYQEAGRAGRDEKYAEAVLLYNDSDKKRLQRQFIDSIPSKKELTEIYKKLCSYNQVAYGELPENSFKFNIVSFSNTYEFNILKVYNTFQILDRNKIIELNKQYKNHYEIQFKVGNKTLINFIEKNKDVEHVVKTLLRNYGGIRDAKTKINIQYLLNKTRVKESKLNEIFKYLENSQIINLDIGNSDTEVRFIKPREDDRTINVFYKDILNLKKVKEDKLKSIIYFYENKSCKSNIIRDYFGYNVTKDCGKCSYCISNKILKFDYSKIKKEVLLLLDKKELNIKEIYSLLNYNKEIVVSIIKGMLEEKSILISPNNKYRKH